jgi:hypothetical protein
MYCSPAINATKDTQMHSPASMAIVPTSREAKLPATYEAARTAIAACERLDECKTWSDKAAALASYARQAKDDSLRVMAIRIQARAERRCGELLKQIEPARGHENGRVPTRSGAAKDAGLSEHQRKTALRIASVPSSDFDRQVESAKPPTVTQLADQGRMRRVRTPDDLTAEHFKAACTALHQFATYCDTHDAIETAQTFGADDMEMARRCVSTLDRWLDLFITNLSANFGG